jgi:hypothetical protein
MGSRKAFVALLALVATAILATTSAAWQQVTPRRTETRLRVTSKETSSVPYLSVRGDGSTGGGGLPMPKQDDGALKRPKVGADMPHGRPPWFRVPAPSQGTLVRMELWSPLF